MLTNSIKIKFLSLETFGIIFANNNAVNIPKLSLVHLFKNLSKE